MGCLTALFGYCLLAVAVSQHSQTGLWIALAFLVIPALAGFVANLMANADQGPRSRFWKGFRQCGLAMFCYAFAELVWLRTRFAMENGGGQIFLVWVFAASAYAVIAGMVAGLVCALMARLGPRRGAADHTSEYKRASGKNRGRRA